MFKNKSCFKTDFGRLKPFILSQCRLKMSMLLVDHVEFLEILHTDGFKSKIELTDLKLSDEIGGLRFEGSRNVKIVNVNKIVDI